MVRFSRRARSMTIFWRLFMVLDLRRLRDRSVDVVAREVHRQQLGELRHADLRRDQLLQAAILVVRLLLRAADHRHEARHDPDGIRGAAEADRAAPDVGVELARLGDILLHGEHDVGRTRREIARGVRLAGLEHHGAALRRAVDIERAFDGEVLALVVEDVDLPGIEEPASRLVARESVVLPAVPQAEHHVGEFLRPRVAVRMGEVGVAIEVERLELIARRHHVPARASAADLVEGRELPRHVIRLVERGRRGGDEADAFGDDRKRGEQHERIETASRSCRGLPPGCRAGPTGRRCRR